MSQLVARIAILKWVYGIVFLVVAIALVGIALVAILERRSVMWAVFPAASVVYLYSSYTKRVLPLADEVKISEKDITWIRGDAVEVISLADVQCFRRWTLFPIPFYEVKYSSAGPDERIVRFCLNDNLFQKYRFRPSEHELAFEKTLGVAMCSNKANQAGTP